MVEFPHELLTLLSSSFSINYDQASIRTEMDSGPPKVRTFQCRTMKAYTVQYHACDCDVIEQFETWWKEESMFGSSWFKWQDPCTTNFVKARLRSEPAWSSEGRNLNNWTLSLELEVWC